MSLLRKSDIIFLNKSVLCSSALVQSYVNNHFEVNSVSVHYKCAISVPRTLGTNMHTIYYKKHFIIKQCVLHINLTANLKYIIKKILKTT